MSWKQDDRRSAFSFHFIFLGLNFGVHHGLSIPTISTDDGDGNNDNSCDLDYNQFKAENFNQHSSDAVIIMEEPNSSTRYQGIIAKRLFDLKSSPNDL